MTDVLTHVLTAPVTDALSRTMNEQPVNEKEAEVDA